MNSKTSFFNRTLFHKDITRLWPVWALYSVFLFFALPFQAYYRLPDAARLTGKEAFTESGVWFADVAGMTAACSPVLICLMAVLAANAVFAYLYQTRSTNMMHAFPVSRSELFGTHFVSGYLFLAVPLIVMYLAATPGFVIQGFKAADVLPGLLYALMVALFFYALAVFCCMLSGHIVASLAWFAILNGVYAVLKMIVHLVISSFSYGLDTSFLPHASKADVLFPLYYLVRYTGMHDLNEIASGGSETRASISYNGWAVVLGYCAAAVALIALSMWLYRRRQLETAGEMNAFKVLNPFVRALVSFCGGGLFGYGMAMIFSRDDALHMVPFLIFFLIFCLIWYLVSSIILKKSFRVFNARFWGEGALIAAVSVALILTLGLKVAGAEENKIPDAHDVKAAAFSCSYPVFTDQQDEIEEIIAVHQTLLDNKNADRELYNRYSYQDTSSDQGTFVDVVIDYAMKDDSVIERHYNVWINEQTLQDPKSSQSAIARFEEKENAHAVEYVFSMVYNDVEITDGMLASANNQLDWTLKGAAAQDLYAALIQDMKQGNLRLKVADEYTDSDKYDTDDGMMYLTLYGRAEGTAALVSTPYLKWFNDSGVYYKSYLLEGASPSTSAAAGGYTTTYEFNVNINKECKNVMAALEKHGITIPDNAFEY